MQTYSQLAQPDQPDRPSKDNLDLIGLLHLCRSISVVAMVPVQILVVHHLLLALYQKPIDAYCCLLER